MKEVFTTGEAAKICHVSQQTIIRCFDSGQLKGFRVPGSRFRRIPRSELKKFGQDNRIPMEFDDEMNTTILIITPSQDLANALKEELSNRQQFVQVESASDTFSAGSIAARLQPRCVVLDYSIGKKEAEAILTYLKGKRSDDHETIVIVLIEASGDLDASWVADVFERPFHYKLLAERIFSLLGKGMKKQ